jgi:hypothetical protein
VRSVFSRSVMSWISEAKPVTLPAAFTIGVLYHSQWMVRPLRATLMSVVLLPSPLSSICGTCLHVLAVGGRGGWGHGLPSTS